MRSFFLELTPLEFTRKLRETDSYVSTLYTRGGCFKFALFLQMLYPTGILYIRKDHKHIVVLIENQLIDINGNVSDIENFTPLTEEDIKVYKCNKWSSDRNLILKDKKKKKRKTVSIDKNIIKNSFFFLVNSIFLAALLLNSADLFQYYHFLNMDIFSKIVVLTLLIIVIVIVVRKMFLFLNKICAYINSL